LWNLDPKPLFVSHTSCRLHLFCGSKLKHNFLTFVNRPASDTFSRLPLPNEMADTAAPVALFKRKGGKGTFRKRPASPPPASDHDSSDDFESSEDEAGQRVKRRRKNVGTVVASSKNEAQRTDDTSTTTVFSADRNASLTSSNDATKAADWYDQPTTDDLSAKALLGSTRAMPSKAVGSAAADGNYKGLANQTKYIQTNPDAPSRKVGPIKAAANIRTITVMDYKPDVCKDYKQTGFCGFGDACIFLHDRTDYKQGWQLDKEWESVTKGKRNLGGTVVASADRNHAAADPEERDEDEEAMLENIPFKCIICKEDYKSPIVTRCGHYFCERCALQRYRKDPSCAACGAGTNGVFNGAKRLQKLLDRKKEREEKRRQEAIEAGEEVADREDEED
jgi:RING finger protein 113A